LRKLRARGLYNSLYVEFQEYEDDPSRGSAELKNLCIYYSTLPSERKTICIFDRDEPSILKQVDGKEEPYRDWGNRVYSFALPEVRHRPNLPEICIELYYKDEEIKRRDSDGRRLYLSEEFSRKSGRSKIDNGLTYPYPKRLSKSKLSIIDSDVYDENDKNVALSKNQFAENILNREDNFDDFDVEAFRAVFDIIAEIVTL
jgi:hypothetical protein